MAAPTSTEAAPDPPDRSERAEAPPGKSGARWLSAAGPRRARAIGLALYVLTTIVFVGTAPRENLTGHTPFNHYALLAEAWLHGHLDLGGPPPEYTQNNDFAEHDGKYYVSFPPFPAVLLVPVVMLAGGAARVRDGQFFLWFAGLGPALLYVALDKMRRSARSARSELENVVLAVCFAFGSVYWFSAIQGTVWFAAHVIAVALSALYLLCALDAEHPYAAGLALGLGVATRPTLAFALPLFLFEAVRVARDRGAKGGEGVVTGVDVKALGKSLAKFALPIAAVGLALLWHNRARFGDSFEFGHRMLAIGWRGRIDKWGLFSYHYLGRNLAVVLTSLPFVGTPGAPFQINVHGLALWITTPIYAWALWPRRTTPLFWVLAATTAAVAAPSLLYQNTGWIQFGYRFSNDFAPFLFAMIAVGDRRMGRVFYGLAAAGAVVNAFGAVTFQRAAFDRFYFVDRTQKILHQPD